MLSTNLRSSWKRGRVNMIFSEDLAVGRKLTYETIFTSIGGPYL